MILGLLVSMAIARLDDKSLVQQSRGIDVLQQMDLTVVIR